MPIFQDYLKNKKNLCENSIFCLKNPENSYIFLSISISLKNKIKVNNNWLLPGHHLVDVTVGEFKINSSLMGS